MQKVVKKLKRGSTHKLLLTKIIIIVLLAVLSVIYISFSQVRMAYSSAETVAACVSNIVKCSAVLASAAMFLAYYVLQEYDSEVSELFESLSHTDMADEQYMYSKYASVASAIKEMKEIKHSNLQYKSKIEQQSERLLENYISQLMKGNRKNRYGSVIDGDTVELFESAEFVQVVVFKIPNRVYRETTDDENAEIRNALRFLINNKLVSSLGAYFSESDGLYCCLFIYGDEKQSKDESSEIEETAKLIGDVIRDRTGQRILVSMGSVQRGVEGISTSFSEASSLIQYSEIISSSDSPLIYSDLSADRFGKTNGSGKNFELTHSFMNSVYAGDYEKAVEIYRGVLESEYISEAVPLNLARCRLFSLVNALILAFEYITAALGTEFLSDPEIYTRILNSGSVIELKKQSSVFFEDLLKFVSDSKQKSLYQRIEDIKTYIHEKYTDPNLSNTSIADAFGMNASYLSRMFKKISGVGLSDYIRNVRVDAAVDLLKDRNLSIQTISEMVGFSGVQTINRAFKEIKGSTAGKLRE